MREISSVAPSGSHFVFIERRGSMWLQRMKEIAQGADLIISESYESRLTKDSDELPEDLGDIFVKLSPIRKPRLTCDIVYSIGVKE